METGLNILHDKLKNNEVYQIFFDIHYKNIHSV